MNVLILSDNGILDAPRLFNDGNVAFYEYCKMGKELGAEINPDELSYTDDDMETARLTITEHLAFSGKELHWFEDIAIEDDVFNVDGFTVEDVMNTAENDEVEITEEEALQILKIIEHRKDANIGVNWDVISTNIMLWRMEHPTIAMVTYDGKEYPTIEFDIEKEGVSTIAGESLGKAIYLEDGDKVGEPKDDDAASIDAMVNFWVPDELMSQSEYAIREHIKKMLKAKG